MNRVDRRALAWMLVASALLGCSLPGRSYEVSPAIAGALHTAANPLAGTRVVLEVHYPDNPVLGLTDETVADQNGEFRFDTKALRVAGKEYGKRYRLLLTLPTRVLWRAEYARTDLGPPVRLDCDLSRKPSRGQACWVINGAQQPWLVAAGRRDFLRLCASCHGREGLGDGPASMEHGSVPPDLTAIAQRRGGKLPRGEIAERIDGRHAPSVHGTRTMPVWGEKLEREFERFREPDEMAAARIDTLVTFLEAIQLE